MAFSLNTAMNLTLKSILFNKTWESFLSLQALILLENPRFYLMFGLQITPLKKTSFSHHSRMDRTKESLTTSIPIFSLFLEEVKLHYHHAQFHLRLDLQILLLVLLVQMDLLLVQAIQVRRLEIRTLKLSIAEPKWPLVLWL